MLIASRSLLNTPMQMCHTDKKTDPLFLDFYPLLFLAVVLLYQHIVYKGLSLALSEIHRQTKAL